MIEKIRRRKEFSFSTSHAEQHHRRKGKDKNKRKKKNNSFKDIEYMDNNPINDNYFIDDHSDVREIFEKINDGEEIKLSNISTVRKVLKNKNFKTKLGTYKFDDGLILEIINYFNNRKIFLIRKG